MSYWVDKREWINVLLFLVSLFFMGLVMFGAVFLGHIEWVGFFIGGIIIFGLFSSIGDDFSVKHKVISTRRVIK